LFAAFKTMRSTAIPSGKFVLRRTCTGKGSRHARVSGHDNISRVSTVVGARVGSDVGADGVAVGARVGAVGDKVGNSDGAGVGNADGA
jgi:hypothetical protein